MPTIKTRTKNLHAAEVERWRETWLHFYTWPHGIKHVEEAWGLVNLAEDLGILEAEEAACDVAYVARAGAEAFDKVAAWVQTARCPLSPHTPALNLWPQDLPELVHIEACVVESAGEVVGAAWQEMHDDRSKAHSLVTADVLACAYILDNARAARAVEAARAEAAHLRRKA